MDEISNKLNKPSLPNLITIDSITLTEIEKELIQNVHIGRDYKKIMVEKEFKGGYGGARVFLVLPVKAGNDADAHVVTKIGSKFDLLEEKQNYENFVKHALPFSAAQVWAYYEQQDWAALNYAFAGSGALGNTVSLEEYYLSHSADEVKITLDVLLGKTLGPIWYGQFKQQLNCFFSEEYGRHLPAHNDLEKTAKIIFQNISSVASDLIKIPSLTTVYPHPLKTYPSLLNKRLKGWRSLVHGDLHLRNVLVDESGKSWLIDFAKVTERHNLFDFIKLETYIRQMALAPVYGDFSWRDYEQFELALNADTLGRDATLPINFHLAKAYIVIKAIRAIARKYMGPKPDFRNEYFPALFLYCLSMLKYHQSHGAIPTQLVFITSCILTVDIFEEHKPMKPVSDEDQNQSEEKGAKPSAEHFEKITQHPSYSATNTGSGAIAQGNNAKAVGAGGVSISGNGNVFVNGKDNKVSQTTTHVNTGGGAYVGGSVNIKNGDFVGRDKTTNSSGASADEIAAIFAQLMQQVDKIRDDSAKTIAQIAVKELKVEAEKGPLATEQNVGKWFTSLSLMAPDIWDVAVDTFSNPIKGLSTVFQKIAQRAKEEKARKNGS